MKIKETLLILIIGGVCGFYISERLSFEKYKKKEAELIRLNAHFTASDSEGNKTTGKAEIKAEKQGKNTRIEQTLFFDEKEIETVAYLPSSHFSEKHSLYIGYMQVLGASHASFSYQYEKVNIGVFAGYDFRNKEASYGAFLQYKIWGR